MSVGRIIIAGIVGGGVMFVWGALAHMALGIGEMGMKNLPNEAMIMPAFRFAMQERGLYRFPPMPSDQSEAAQKAWDEKAKAGPIGLVVYDPSGMQSMGTLLGWEFASNVLAALLLAAILSGIGASKGTGALVGVGMGLFAWACVCVSYWNWYRFPTAYMIGELLEQGIGGLVTGLTVGLVLSRGGKAKPELF